MLLPKQKGGSGVLNNPGTTYTVVRVGILCQEQFQDALRERLDLRGVRNARIRDWCQAVRIPCVGYPSPFHILDVLEHELDRIYGCLTRNEDHWSGSSDQGTAIGENNIILRAPQGVLVWQFAK
jgi:hypothetical protein